MPLQSRRDFLHLAAASAAGFTGLGRFFTAAHAADAPAPGLFTDRFGPLLPDPQGLLDLPRGFTYRVLSRVGDLMTDGLFVPGKPDGMAAFEGPDGLTILVRNHEVDMGDEKSGPFGPRHERLNAIDRAKIYDPGAAGKPAPGGTSTLVYDTRDQRVLRQFMSSAGHCRNCAGGATPWGSWLTCEETVLRAGEEGAARNHGYVFEVPATADIRLADPTPIRPMGRFNHEAVCVDPRTGVVYLTEDRGDGLLYRFIPDTPGRLLEGGRLEALALRDAPGFDTRNWDQTDFPVGDERPVAWIPLDEVDAETDDLRDRGHAAGAARFARGEGIHWAHDSVYAVCTSGGRNRRGQVWRYLPSPNEGTPAEAETPGRLALFVEPNDRDLIDMPDNIAVAPWGDLIVCEDNGDEQRLVAVTPEGRLYHFARNAKKNSEFAGACFSPDGTTMFVNIQHTGLTLAVTGPWRA